MKKKLLIVLLTLLSVVCLAFALSACGGSGSNASGGAGSGGAGGHTHDYGEIVAEKPATCTQKGLKAHYYCEGCQKYFDEEKTEKTLTELEIAVDATAHTYGEWVDGVPATCSEEGMQAHYHCACGKYFDESKEEITEQELTIPINENSHSLNEGESNCADCGAPLTEGLGYGHLIGDSTYTVYKGSVNGGNIIIPAKYNGKPVTSIGDYAFGGCTSLESITIPDTVTHIGYDAFYNCTSLRSITIPDSVTSIGDQAFYNCTSLTSITIPDSVTSIGAVTFSGCTSLESITIGTGVTYIGYDAFYYCTNLTSIEIPDGVTSIGDYAFRGCTATINWGSNPTIKKIGRSAFCGYKGTSITIPDSVTSIGDYAFNSCTNLTSITIPDSVTSIGYYAFYYCTNLTSIEIPDGVTSIGDYAFFYCTSLTSVIFQNTTGWKVSYSSIMLDATGVNVTDATNNAELLTNTYHNRYWKRYDA